MAQIFTKRTGAPLGTYHYTLGGRDYILTDTAPTDTITVSNLDDIAFFAQEPEINFVGSSGSYVPPPNYSHPERLMYASILDPLIVGAITRDSNGAPISSGVVWPDGQTGSYVATQVSVAFPGSVDAYIVTYGSPVNETYTQPVVTRDASTGAVTNRPGILLS